MIAREKHQELTSAKTWLVSTQHWVPLASPGGPAERPYGTKHAREAGEGLTACGKFAVGWRIFWDMTFTTADGEACPACVDAVSKTHTLRHG